MNDGVGARARAPEVHAGPVGQVVREGEPATFAATFTAASLPALQWHRATPGSGTWVAVAGATAAAFTTPPAAPADHGTRYRLQATNEVGTTTTGEALLEVTWLHLVGPADAVVTAGADAPFTVALDARPAPSLRWELARPAETWQVIPGAVGPSYVFPAPAESDDGTRLRVVAENAFGIARSAEATLRVVSAPVIMMEPTHQSVGDGEAATFTAEASGLPAPLLQWERLAPGGVAWMPVLGATASTLVTPPAAPADLGARYRLVATNAHGTAVSRAAELTVRWLHLLASPPDLAVVAGEDATFQAAFEGQPAPAVQWQRAAPGGPWLDVPGATSASFVLRAAALPDDGVRFRVVASNAAGSVATAAATLTVIPRPQVVAFSAEPARITAGGSTMLSFAFTGGLGSIDGAPVTGEAGSVPVTPVATHAYTLTVTSPLGPTASAQATVTVFPVPVLVSFRAGADHVPPGAATTLLAEFDAGPEGSALVDRGVGAVEHGVPAATGPITSATSFTLTVTNGAGRSVTETDTVTLGIDVAPGESVQAAIDRAVPGTTVHLQPGNYSPLETAEAFLVFRPEKDGVVLRGAGAEPGDVVLDGQDRVLHVVFFDEGITASTRLENLTITRGRAYPEELFPGGFTPVLRPEISQTAAPESDFYHDGGAIMIFASAPTVDGLVLRENVSSLCAGAVSVFARDGLGFPAAGPVIRNSEFLHNRAGIVYSGGGIGGAIDVYNGTRATIVNDLFVGNTGWGAQVAVLGGAVATVRNSTFDGAGLAGGVMVGSNGVAAVLDNVFVNQSPAGGPPVILQPDSSATVLGSVYWNFEASWVPPEGSGLVADPLFAEGPRGAYYLSQSAAGQAATSPAVDAGSFPATDSPGRTTRTDGVADEGAVDLGYRYAP